LRVCSKNKFSNRNLVMSLYNEMMPNSHVIQDLQLDISIQVI